MNTDPKHVSPKPPGILPTLLVLLLGTASPLLLAQQTWDQDSERRMDPPQSGAVDFAALDTDQNGSLSPHEIPPDHPLALQFAALDTDGDGALSREEADALESAG